MIMHLISENLYKRAVQETTTTCSMYPCSKSFLMCQWRQITSTGYQAVAQHHQPQVCLLFSGECGNVGFSVAPSWKVSITEDLSVQCDTEAWHGSLCFIKANLPLELSARLCVLSPPGPEPFQGWERRLRLSFCLAISSFYKKKTERGEESTDPRSSICQSQRDLSIHPSIRETG